MKKNKFNKEEQNLFAVGGFMTPYGMAGFTPYGVPMGTPSASQITMYYDGLNAKKEIASRKNNKQSNINAGVSSKLFEDGGTLFDYDIAPTDNTRVNTSVVLPVERQSNFTDSNYFWDSGSEFPAGFWRQKNGSFKTTNIANGEPITFTQEEVDSIVRANTAKGRKERLKKAMESKFAYGGLMNDSPTLLNAMPKNIKAIGGVVQTNSSDFSTGLTHINNGGSHEESPYDGVQIGIDSEGVPNLVEEGEVIFNDYVFSKRIQLDEEAKKKFHFPKKSELSYADAAKKLEMEVKERPNDPISRASFKAQMEQLEEQQERQKQEMEAERAKEAFEALSPGEQTALMQQKAQQDAMAQQQAQEQAIAEAQAAQGQPSPEEMAAMEQQAAMAQQQMSPEEAAMMQQQMTAPQGGMPVEGMAPEGYAYGGELGEDKNLFADGGAAWLKNEFPGISDKYATAIGALLDKRAAAKYPGRKSSDINYRYFYDELLPGRSTWNSWGRSERLQYDEDRKALEDDMQKVFKGLVSEGLDSQIAMNLIAGQMTWDTDPVKNRKQWNSLYNNWMKGVKNGETQSQKPNVSEKTTVNPLANVTSKYSLAAPEDQYKVDNGQVKFWSVGNVAYPTEEAARNALKDSKKAENQKVAKEAVTEKSTKVAQQAATSASSPQSSKAAQSVVGDKAKSGNIKNVGAWKDDGSFADHWQTYSAPGLDEFLKRKEAEYKAAETDEQRAKITDDTAREVNEIQQSYWDYILPNRGKSSYNKDDNVYNHQSMWDERGGNVGFWPASDDGSLSNKIASAIDLPAGYNTGDNPAGQGRDGYNGRQTELRFLGSTATGDEKFFNDYVDRFKNLGVSFSPYSGWDNNGERLYRASVIGEPATEIPATPEEVVVTPSGAVTRAAATAEENPAEALKASDAEIKKNGEATTGEQVAPKVVPNLKKESYWGLFGPAVGLGMQMAGIGKPDTSGIDAAIASANSAPHLAEYKPLGNYLTYRPMDVWFEQNALNAQSRATDRSIMNAGVNQGGTMAGLIANGYNSQLASGELFRKGLEYNNQDEITKATFNRGTDQYNADAFTRNSQFNADVLNRGKQYAASLGLQGAAQKMDADAGWYNGIYGNVSGIFDRLNQWEKWKRDHNTIAKMAADGLFGNMSDRQYTGQGFLKTVSAEGGKTKRKKARKKKGFTF